jgi:hypothetical protein
MLKHQALLASAILCGSCGDQGSRGTDSLVGATKLPSAEVLSRETLYITRGSNGGGGDRLAYELRPGDSLAITHTYFDPRTFKVEVRAKDAFRVRPEVTARFRRLMWRVRPERLGRILDNEVRPLGCKRRGPHDFGEVSIAFINEGAAETAKDLPTALFELPWPDSCHTRAAKVARKAVREALGLLPKSRAVESFEGAS